MLEGLVATLLNRFLGIYIQNFDPKQLNIGIWSGDVKLRDLELRKDALDQLKLPVNVVEGYLGQLSLQIPWSNLKNKPVRVVIENVFVLVAPKAEQEYDEEEEIQRQVRVKLEKLHNAELLRERVSAGMSEEEQQKSQTFTESLVTKIVDNLQVTVKNIHVRYEDAASTPGHPFAVGITLEEFSAVSTNEDWVPAFIQGRVDATHKLVRLGSLAVYWNTDSTHLSESDHSHGEVLEAFKSLISTSENKQSDHQFILRPVNGVGKLRMDKSGQHDQPAIHASLAFDEIGFIIDEDQYRDALMLVDLFHFYMRHQQFKKFRPKGVSPKEDPRAWLKFATDAVLSRIHERNRKWSWDYFRERRDDRKRYIELFIKKRKQEAFSQNETEEYDKLEAKLSYEDLRFYRSLGRNQLRKEATIVKKSQPPPQKATWGQWLWGKTDESKSEERIEDTVITEEQKKELFEAIDWDEKKELTETLDVPRDTVKLLVESTLRAGSFTLRRDPHSSCSDVLSIVFETFKAKFGTRPDSFFAELSLGELKIFDGTTPGTLYRQIVRIKNENDSGSSEEERIREVADEEVDSVEGEDVSEKEGDEDSEPEPFFQASFEKNPLDQSADSAFSAKMRSMEIIYNPRFIEGAYNFFKPPERHMESINALLESASTTVENIRQQTRAGLEFALEEHKTLNAKLDLQAPLIIIPESVTDEDTQCIVLDVGNIHLSSDLVDKEAVEEVQSKQQKQYTDKDFEQLENLMYDKFLLQLQSTQVLIGPSISQTLKQLKDPNDSKHLHIVDRINIDFQLQISILPKAPNLTRFKIAGHLPVLHVSISDKKYKTLMRLIDVAIPNFDTEEEKKAEEEKMKELAQLDFGETGFGTSKAEELIVDEGSISGDDEEEKEKEKDKKGKNQLDAAQVMLQKTFELTFTVDKLQGSLYQANQDDDEETKLVDLVAEHFSLVFFLRKHDMSAEVVLQSLNMDDFISEDMPPEFRTMISSVNNGDNSSPLFSVKYTKIKPLHPELLTTYEGIDTHVDVDMSTLSVVITPRTLLTLLNFVLTTFTTPQPQPPSNKAQIMEGTEEEQSILQPQDPNQSKIKVQVDMASINLILNHDGIRLGTLSVEKGDARVLVLGARLQVAGHIGKFSLTDDVDRGASGESNLRQLIKVEGENLAEYRYETFDRDSDSYPGYDALVYLRLQSIVVHFVEEPFRKLYNFAIKFGRMQALFNAARIAAMNQAQQIQEGANKFHFDIVVATPIVTFPRPGPQQIASHKQDEVTAYLGEIYAKNCFSPLKDNNEQVVNHIDAGLRNTRLTSSFHYEEAQEETLEIIDRVDLSFEIELIDHKGTISRPNVEVKSNMSDIRVKLTQDQYKFALQLANSIPGVFTVDEVDEEEMLNSLPAPDRVKSDLMQRSENPSGTSTPQTGHVFSSGMGPELSVPPETWTTLDVVFHVGTIALDLFTSDAEHPVGDLKATSLSTAYLTNVKVKLKGLSNSSMESEVLIDSFNMRDTRRGGSNQFRKVISSTNTEGHQIMASFSSSGGKDSSMILLLTIDSPTLIFSLDYLFSLQNYAMAPFTDSPPIEEIDVYSDDTLGVPGDASSSVITTRSRARSTATGTGQAEKIKPAPQAPKLSYRVNIVDAQVILTADPSQSNTEAILLNTAQLVLSQQNALTLQISKVSMFLCRMDALEGNKLRLLDEFSVSASMNSKRTEHQSMTNIEVQIDPLVLRVSLREVLLAMQIVNKATEMSQPDKKGQDKPSKLKQLEADNSNLKKRTASGRPVSSRYTRQPSGKVSTASHASRAGADKDSGIINREQLRAVVDGVRVVLIGDLYELPMLDMSVKKFAVHVSDWSGSLKADCDIETFLNVYNFSKSAWEPLLEPWKIGFHATRESSSEKLSVDVYSRKVMELTVSSQTIALISRATQFIQRNEDMLSKPRRVEAPYIIRNQTGFDLDVWAVGDPSADLMAVSLKDGQECPWRFEVWEKMRENLSPEGSSGVVGIKLRNSKYDSINRIPVTREGETLYTLKTGDGSLESSLLCEVRLAENNIKHIIFRSSLLVENKTAIPLELGILDPHSRRVVQTYKIQPGQSQPAPIEQAWSHQLLVRPDPGFGYAWSEEVLNWRDLLKNPTSRVKCRNTSQSGDGSPFIFQMHARNESAPSSYPRIRIGLFAPVEVQNLLPYDFNFRVYDKRTGNDWTNFLRRGGSSPVHVVELSSLILMSVNPQETEYGASEFAIINAPNTEYDRESWVQLKDSEGRPLNLKLHYYPIPDGGGAFRVAVYSPYIILNKTGLDVGVRSGGAHPYTIRLPAASIEGDDIKAHQHMFSFGSDDRKNRATLQVGESEWSKPQSFEAINSNSEVILSSRSRRTHLHLGVSVEEGKGKYKLTKVITLTPRFVLRNKLNEELLFKQATTDESKSIKAGEMLPLHFMHATPHKQLCLAYSGSKDKWTSPFTISNLGSIHLKIAKAGRSQELLRVEIMAEGATLFLHITRETGNWPYMIRNESDMEFTFFQTNPIDEWDDDEDNDIPYYRPIRYRLPERSLMPYAWDYPAAKRKELTLVCGRTERNVRLTEIGAMIPMKIPIEGSRHPKMLDINVIADGPTQTLVISNYKPQISLYKPKDNSSQSSFSSASREGFEVRDEDSGVTFNIRLQLAGIGISLINKQPKELAYITFRDLELVYSESSLYQMIKTKIKWIQIDNQLYGGVFPMIMYPSVVPKTGKEMESHPSFHASLTRVKDDSYGVLYIKFATLLLQQMTIEIDEDFIFALLDFTDIPGASWTIEEDDKLCDDRLALPEPKSEQGGQEMYFEFFNIQPMQLDLSFMRTEVVNAENKWSSKNPITFLLNVLTMAVGNVNDAPIKFNALMLENARVTVPVLTEHVQKHYSQDFIYQIHKILGSADFLGNPVGLFNNISSGVYDIFYEPYQGFTMTDRPQELGIGIAKGATSFVKKSVFGVSDSLSKFTGSISKGLSAATLDKQFQDRRRMSRNRNRPKHALYGVTTGAQSFATSLASGVGGLAKKPLEGAAQEGAFGFLKGIGKGVVGLTTKPVIGVFDLASNVTEGIRNTTTVFDQEGLDRVRLTRYIGRDGIVRPYSQREALGQFWLKQLDNGKHFNEEYVAHLELQEQDMVVMVTYQRIMLVKAKRLYSEWDISLREIRTISKERTGITLVLRHRQGPFIPIRDREQLEFLFGKISHVVHVFNSASST